MNATTLIGVIAVSGGVLGATVPAAAQVTADRTTRSEKGSLLVFPKIELRWDAAGNLLQDTFISVQNDFPGNTIIRMFWLNGDPPLAPAPPEPGHPGWNFVDFLLPLTANQPGSWSASTGLPFVGTSFTILDPGVPPGRPDPEGSGERVLRGLVYLWAVNVDDEPINWNNLSGTATVVNYADSSAWEYRGQAFAALAGAQGDPVGTAGTLLLDGNDYAGTYDRLLLDFQAVGSVAMSGPRLVAAATDLTTHPVSIDFRQDGGGPVTTKMHVEIWNQNEVKFTGTERCITCWDETLLANFGLPNNFLLSSLQTDFGWARITGIASTVCDGPGVTSVDAPLLAVAARLVDMDSGTGRAAAGTNIPGGGFDGSAMIRWDVPGPPPESAPTGPPSDGPLADVHLGTDEGSLLIFPNVELRWDSAGALVQDTFVTLQNHALSAVAVRLVFLNGDPPDGGEPGWNSITRTISLTASQPTWWSALSGAPAGLPPFTDLDPGLPPGRPDPEGSGERILRGTIYAWAVNAAGEEIRRNSLTGMATIVNYADFRASQYRAYASAAVDPAVAEGEATGTPGVLDLDGVEFAPGPGELLLDFTASGSLRFSSPSVLVSANTDLTLHPIAADFRAASAGPVATKANFRIWNENEVQFSGTEHCVSCWDQTLLSTLPGPNWFNVVNLQTDTGRARIDGIASIVCPGSTDAALVGVATRVLAFDAQTDVAASHLAGTGTEPATIVVDLPCPADLSGNGQVDFADILIVLGAWGPCGVPCPADLSGNGQVDFADILIVIGAWGACP